MAIPNFFSIERKGYIKVSDLFYDVMQDMLEHGFTFINCSNAHKDRPLTFWKPTVLSSTAGKNIGDKLYILDGTRQEYAGSTRPAPYVTVTSVSNGAVTGVSEVISYYDFPIWTDEILPTTQISLSTDQQTMANSGVVVTLANITAQSDRTTTTANVIAAPATFTFTLEASGDVDPLNGLLDPNSSEGAELPNSAKQPWRVQFVIPEEQKASAAVATNLQMFYDEAEGRVRISKITDDFGFVVDNVGVTGAQQPAGIFEDTDLNQGIYNRKLRVANQPQTFPLSYVLTITNRGFFLGIFEGSWSTTRAATTTNSNYFNWILVQRPVDRGTGKILTAGKAPVFHINSVNYKYYKSVVRESDILHPTAGPLPVPHPGWIIVAKNPNGKSKDWQDPTNWIVESYETLLGSTPPTSGADPNAPKANFISNGILKPGMKLFSPTGKLIGTIKSVDSETQLTLTSKPKFEIMMSEKSTFGYLTEDLEALRVLADRHSPDSHAIFNSVEQVSLTEDKTYLLSFPHNLTTPRFRYTEELDMIGTTSSDVVMGGQDIQFKTYGEVGPRTYRALSPNGALNTGLRIAALWAPQGPRWTSPNGEVSPTDLGQITAGSQPGTILTADPVPVLAGETPRALPYFRIERGSLPSGLTLEKVGDQWQLRGVVNAADYFENTVIKFTIAAVNQEDPGYSLKDFYFTYIV